MNWTPLLRLRRRFTPAIVTALSPRMLRAGIACDSYEVRGPFRAEFGDNSNDVLVSADGYKFYMPLWGRLIVEAK